MIIDAKKLTLTLTVAALILQSCAELPFVHDSEDENETPAVSDNQESQATLPMDSMTSIAMRLRKPPAPTPEMIQIQKEAEETRFETAARQGQLAIGMPKSHVQDLWGEPVRVEIAGNPEEGHEKWVYYQGLSSRWGLGTTREVYFENGKVAGWNTSSH